MFRWARSDRSHARSGPAAHELRSLEAAFERNTVDGCPRVCDVVQAVRRRVGGEDLSDAVAFLKWIYQKKVKQAVHK